MNETDFTALRAAARQVVTLMRDTEADVAEALQELLFPDGPPESVSIAMMMRAMMAILTAHAERMAEADIAHSRALRKYQPASQQSESLISPEVALRLAQTAELEDIVANAADDTSQTIESLLFPLGAPDGLSILDLLEACRRHLETAILDSEKAAADDAMEVLRKPMVSVASMYMGYCGLVEQNDVADEIQAWVERYLYV